MLANGVFKKTDTGLLIPASVVLAAGKPRPAHADRRGRVTDVTKAISDETFAIVKDHYERKTGKAIVGKVANAKFRRLVYRAVDALMSGRK